MKTIAIAAVTAGGKTSVTNALKSRLENATSLHFDDYTFDGEVEDFGQWVRDGGDYSVWDITPLKQDVERIKNSGKYEYLLLDYPFAYQHPTLKDEIDCAIFIDTPLDIALARRVLRDMKDASGDDIRTELDTYINYARPAFVHMLKTILPDSDAVVDGARELEKVVEDVEKVVRGL